MRRKPIIAKFIEIGLFALHSFKKRTTEHAFSIPIHFRLSCYSVNKNLWIRTSYNCFPLCNKSFSYKSVVVTFFGKHYFIKIMVLYVGHASGKIKNFSLRRIFFLFKCDKKPFRISLNSFDLKFESRSTI